jgi:dihydropteroate synthase
MPALEAIVKAFPHAPISIDTFYSLVAHEALKAGASVVNDVSAGSLDPELWNVVAKHQAVYLLMHMQGEPQSMQNKPQYTHVTQEVIKFISLQLNTLRNKGISDVWIDPGFGFGKTLEHNFQLLRELEAFQLFNCPILVGMSRKKMIQTATGRSSEEVIYGTTTAHFAALERGAAILRVHDVEPARQAIAIYQNLRTNI